MTGIHPLAGVCLAPFSVRKTNMQKDHQISLSFFSAPALVCFGKDMKKRQRDKVLNVKFAIFGKN